MINAREHRPGIHSANLSIVSEEAATDEIATLYEYFRSRFGRPHVPGILQCFATHPPLLQHMMGLAETMLFTEGALGRQQKEMLATFVSSANECAYCADSHGFFLRVHGGSEGALQAALGCDLQSPSLTPRQQKWLRFVAKVNQSSASVTPADVHGLRREGWTDLQIAETVHLTALFAAFNRVVNAFGVSSQGLLLNDAEKLPENES